MSDSLRRLWPFLLPLVLLYVVYGSIFIHDSSFVVDGKRVFCLLDDPMISMRYARNLADGLGLVWNAGERVEGITNPGWTFIMALVHLVEHDRTVTSLYMQVISLLCNVVTVILTAMLGLKLSGGSRTVAIGAAALTAFYYPANYWSLYGMETGLLAMLITMAVWLYLRPQPRADWPVYLVMGLATIVRFDAVVPLLVIGGYATLTAPDWPGRRRHALLLAGTLAVFIGGQTIARLMYYGYPFPNTYYLKMTGFPVLQRMARGAYVTGATAWYLLWPLAIVGVASLAVAIIRRRTFGPPKPDLLHLLVLLRNPIIILVLLVLAQILYSCYVGGDAWEYIVNCNRYVVISIPFIMLLTTLGLCRFVPKAKYLNGPAHLVGFILLLGIFTRTCSSEEMQDEVWLLMPTYLQYEGRFSFTFARRLDHDYAKDKTAIDTAGSIPYFSNKNYIDILGKCEVQIAHSQADKNPMFSPVWFKYFMPGHMKWNMPYVLERYKPNVLVIRFFPLAVESKRLINQNIFKQLWSGYYGTQLWVKD